MELSKHIREFSKGVSGKQQLVVRAFARALECIPRALACNAGFDATDILNKLRQKHATGKEERHTRNKRKDRGPGCQTYSPRISRRS